MILCHKITAGLVRIVKKVLVSNDQEKPKLERNSNSKNRGGRNRLRSHRSRLFGCTVYVFRGTRILEIKHYAFLIPGYIGGHYSNRIV